MSSIFIAHKFDNDECNVSLMLVNYTFENSRENYSGTFNIGSCKYDNIYLEEGNLGINTECRGLELFENEITFSEVSTTTGSCISFPINAHQYEQIWTDLIYIKDELYYRMNQT